MAPPRTFLAALAAQLCAHHAELASASPAAALKQQQHAATTTATTSTTWSYSSFTYTAVSTDRYATPLASPLTQPAWAPPYSEASTLLPTGVTYTTYSLQRPTESSSLTAADDGPYGQSAYAALWANTTYTNQLPFTTTASATPVATSELVFPPRSPVRPVDEAPDLKFPADFIWGGAASAWQIEGGLQFGGRGPGESDSIGAVGPDGEPVGDASSDFFGSAATNDSNVADMHYFLYRQDIARLAAIGLPYYSFSIAWPRVVPFGVAGSPVNTEALDHYDDVIDACIEYGVTPVATLLHIDSPRGMLDDLAAFPDHFLYYAQQVMARYADRVPVWVTINEPNVVVPYDTSDYNALTAELLAHAKVAHWYREELGGTGRITTKLANNLALPRGGPASAADVDAALRYEEIYLMMAYPLFLGQQYPEVALQTIDSLVPLTDEQIAYINGTADFWALDPYVGQFAAAPPGGIEACAANASDALWPECAELGYIQANGWLIGAQSQSYVYIAPQGIRQQLSYIWNTFRPSGILVSEFGFPVEGEYDFTLDNQRYDLERSIYYTNFLTEMLHSIHSDGVNLIGALAWSFLDNNEFGSYTTQFGMQTVNRTSGLFERTYKRSIFDYVDFLHDHVASE
ncbi:beta-glucosidase [Xylariaceae sp. FL0804]|nr:beta-glucosidase [Xylariaceae sp. FL0804]